MKYFGWITQKMERNRVLFSCVWVCTSCYPNVMSYLISYTFCSSFRSMKVSRTSHQESGLSWCADLCWCLVFSFSSPQCQLCFLITLFIPRLLKISTTSQRKLVRSLKVSSTSHRKLIYKCPFLYWCFRASFHLYVMLDLLFTSSFLYFQVLEIHHAGKW